MVKVFANASAATPPAVYFAKTFTVYPALEFIEHLNSGYVSKIDAFGLMQVPLRLDLFNHAVKFVFKVQTDFFAFL